MLNKRHGGLAGPRAHIWTLLSCVYRLSSGGKMGQDLENWAAHPHQRLPGVPHFRGQEQGVNHVGWFISVIIYVDEVYPWTRWYTRRSFAPGACPWSMLQEQNPSCVSAFILTDFEIVIRNFTRPFWNITQGIYAEYHVQIMLLFVYTTTGKRFVIFTCKYFELSIPLSQSNCRNFSCSSITTRILIDEDF